MSTTPICCLFSAAHLQYLARVELAERGARLRQIETQLEQDKKEEELRRQAENLRQAEKVKAFERKRQEYLQVLRPACVPNPRPLPGAKGLQRGVHEHYAALVPRL